jgi:hypothetical protein
VSDTKERAIVDLIKASLVNLSDDELEETADAVLREAKKRGNGASDK